MLESYGSFETGRQGALLMRALRYDVGISYASEDRDIAVSLSNALEARKVRVFFDESQRLALWGRDLRDELRSVYFQQSSFVMPIISDDYLTKRWTVFEFEAICERLTSEGVGFLVPIRVGKAPIPPQIEWVACLQYSEEQEPSIVAHVIATLGKFPSDERLNSLLRSRLRNDRLEAVRLVGNVLDPNTASTILLKTLEVERDGAVKTSICQSLRTMKPTANLGPLYMLLYDSDWAVRSAAGWALVDIGEPCRDDVEAIARTAQSEETREMAGLVLEKLAAARQSPQ